MTTNDIDAIRAEWLRQCGLHDAGLLTECTCSNGDFRSLVAALCDEIERLRAEREHMELHPTGTVEWLKNRVKEQATELDGLRAQVAAVETLLKITDGDPLGDRGIAIALGEIRRVLGEAREEVPS